MNFSDFNFNEKITATLDAKGFADCTPIQSASIPLILEGKDVAGLAQTGTGKTAAYLLPLIERVLGGMEKRGGNSFADWKKGNFVLILVPTRELSTQVFSSSEEFLKGLDLAATSIFGGSSYQKQREAIDRGVEFVVATPGRLIDLFKENVIDLKQVKAIVFDEADRMFDMGFKDDMKYILRRVPRERQFLVYSATLNFDVLNVAYEFGASPVEVNVSKDQAKAENVNDKIFHIGSNEKPCYLLSLLKLHKVKQVIVFTNFKHHVETIERFLTRNNLPAMGISSLLTQVQRNRVMALFKESKEKNILVATDVAARGLDVKDVDIVINYDLPGDPENYVHRIGRTGRAGEKGLAFSFVSDVDIAPLARIEEYLGNKIDVGWVDSKDLIEDFVQIQNRRSVSLDKSKKFDTYKRPAGQRGYKKKRTDKRDSSNRTGSLGGGSLKSSDADSKRTSSRGTDESKVAQKASPVQTLRPQNKQRGALSKKTHSYKKTQASHSKNKSSQVGATSSIKNRKKKAKSVYKGGKRVAQASSSSRLSQPNSPKKKVSSFLKKLFS